MELRNKNSAFPQSAFEASSGVPGSHPPWPPLHVATLDFPRIVPSTRSNNAQKEPSCIESPQPAFTPTSSGSCQWGVLDTVLSIQQLSVERDPWGPDLAQGQIPSSLSGSPPVGLGQTGVCWGEAGRLLSVCSPLCGQGPPGLGMAGKQRQSEACHHLKPHHGGKEMERQPHEAASGTSSSLVPGGMRGLYRGHGT